MVKPGRLYVIATPIGNLEDMSFRAIACLKEVDAILVEDKRHSGKLLKHYQIDKPLYVYNDHTKIEAIDQYITLLLQGTHLALISDAGTPLVSDPGFRLVRQARLTGITIHAVPGPSALTAALSIAGLPTDRFVFEGFLPSKSIAREQRLLALKTEKRTLIFYEAPHRLVACVEAMLACLGPTREVVLLKELTKLYEQVIAADLKTLAHQVATTPTLHRGEVVLMVRGLSTKEAAGEISLEAKETLALLYTALPLTKAAALTAKLTGFKRAQLYDYGMLHLT